VRLPPTCSQTLLYSPCPDWTPCRTLRRSASAWKRPRTRQPRSCSRGWSCSRRRRAPRRTPRSLRTSSGRSWWAASHTVHTHMHRDPLRNGCSMPRPAELVGALAHRVYAYASRSASLPVQYASTGRAGGRPRTPPISFTVFSATMRDARLEVDELKAQLPRDLAHCLSMSPSTLPQEHGLGTTHKMRPSAVVEYLGHC
jgi:hypothetical protein